MENKFTLENLKLIISKQQFKLKQFSKEVWPINWSNFKKPKMIVSVFLEANYTVKSIFTISVVGLIISLYFLLLGSYLALTVEVAASGGEIREAVIESNFKTFNPVLNLESNAEKKVAKLLFHPLYEVVFPDYLNNPNTDPIITPILLKGIPQWQDLEEAEVENRYKRLQFELRDDIKWSDGSSINTEDIEYTFNRLKENGANQQFRTVFESVELLGISETVFELRSLVSDPQLIYKANFSPISVNFFNSQSIEQLEASFNSSKPLVTSGYFTFTSDQVQDPDLEEVSLRDNPIREAGVDDFRVVVLTRNPIQNTNQEVKIENYIFKRYDRLLDEGGEQVDSLERDARDGKIDIFTRDLNPGLAISSEEVSQNLGLNQSIIPNNTFFTIFLNIRRNDIFLNQVVRRFLFCSLVSFDSNFDKYPEVRVLPENKRIVPIQFNSSFSLDCPQNPEEVLAESAFQIDLDQVNKTKRMVTCGRTCTQVSRLDLIGFENYSPLLTDFQVFLRDIGIPANVITDFEEVDTRLNVSKDYSIALVPITLINNDPYPFYGARGRDLSQIRTNNQESVTSANFEENILKYSQSNLTNEESKNSLISFFENNYISSNLFRTNTEINYSDRINNLSNNLPALNTINLPIYLTVSEWYTETRRELIL